MSLRAVGGVRMVRTSRATDGRGRRLAAALVAASWAGACGSGEAPPAPSGRAMGQAAAVRTHNDPPVLESVRLEPPSPRPGQLVRAVPVAQDPDGDGITYTFAWRVGGATLRDAKAEVALDAGTPRGTRIEVVVVAKDGKGESRPASASATIGNQAPELVAVALEPAGEITRGHPVVARPRAVDPDGDELTYHYAWRINGEEVGVDGDSLDTTLLKRGDTVQVRVVASDRDDESNPIESPPLRVANAAPKFLSQPSGFDSDGTFRYTPQAEDPDGDRTLRFRLDKAPEGMAIDGLSGAVSWKPQATQLGRHPVELVVEDRQGGSATQRFELSVAEGDAPKSASVPPAALAPGDEEPAAPPARAATPQRSRPAAPSSAEPAADDTSDADATAAAAPPPPAPRRTRPAPATPSPPSEDE